MVTVATDRKIHRGSKSRPIIMVVLVMVVMVAMHSVWMTPQDELSASSIASLVQEDLVGNAANAATDIALTSGSAHNQDRFSLAKRESLGFFDDVDNITWERLKQRFKRMRPNMLYRKGQRVYKEHANHPNFFWIENYDPEFTCINEEKYGPLGDGGKWLCDPHRVDKDNCIVYSVGSHGDFSFETAIQRGISKSCDIHTFDRVDRFNKKDFKKLAVEAEVQFHHTALGSATKEFPNAKRFKEIIQDFKHEGKTIDIMKIDCEGCEWGQYLEWFEDWKATNVKVRTLVIELHKSPLPQAPDFFEKMLEMGYVIFHKELNGLNPECIEYGFVLLHEDFQK